MEQLNKAPEKKAENGARRGAQRKGQPRKDAQRGAKNAQGDKAARADRSSRQNRQDGPVQAQVGKAADAVRRTFQRRPRQGQNRQPAVPVHLYPLGGLGEVGKNITLYECGQDMLLVDCGTVFPDSDMFGIDLVIPDFTFVVQNRDRIRGVIITHGHEDHIGGLPYLLKAINIPVYATRLTLGLIRNKLEEHGLLGSTKLVEISPRNKFKLGCFSIEPIHVNHSIPDAVAFAITCPAGVILHTGDFKVDYTPISGGPTDLATIAEYGRNGVLALLSDSTNADRPGFTATEHKVGEAFETLFRRAEKKRIIIATFASNVYRIQQISTLR